MRKYRVCWPNGSRQDIDLLEFTQYVEVTNEELEAIVDMPEGESLTLSDTVGEPYVGDGKVRVKRLEEGEEPLNAEPRY